MGGDVSKLPNVPPIGGVRNRKGDNDSRSTRLEVLAESIAESPHLVREIESAISLGRQTWKYRFRQAGVGKMGGNPT